MKCIKDLVEDVGNILRVSNEDADKLVKTGNYAYCPKSEYKLQEKRKILRSMRNSK
jgi:hypothetical protein